MYNLYVEQSFDFLFNKQLVQNCIRYVFKFTKFCFTYNMPLIYKANQKIDEDIEYNYEDFISYQTTNSDIYLFPSVGKTECYGIVQIEAMRHSKPVINTWLHNGVNSVSIDGETGITVEPENVEQLTNAIKELLNNDELRLEYGRNARKRVENLFDIEKVKEQYISVYRKGASE